MLDPGVARCRFLDGWMDGWRGALEAVWIGADFRTGWRVTLGGLVCTRFWDLEWFGGDPWGVWIGADFRTWGGLDGLLWWLGLVRL